jgi:hypothetical protein
MIKNILKFAPTTIIIGSLLAILSACGGKTDTSTTSSPSPISSGTNTNSPTAANTATTNSANTTTATPSSSPTTASATSSQLTFQQSLLAKKTADNKVAPSKDAVFKRGDTIYFVLLNVGKFKKGNDGKNWLDMDMSVKDAKGKVIFTQKNLLGEKGKAVLENDIAPSPNGSVNTNNKVAPGVYQVTLTLYDKVAGTEISETKSFTLK